MATTTNGIYYPNDYESVADIPTDMKKMAESVDTKIAENKTEINNIKTEQTTQNTNISNLQKDNTTNKQDITNIKAKDTEQDKYIAELEAENARLREDLNGLPKRQASGESIDLNDSAEMRCDLKISGNSKQETRSGKNMLELIEGTYSNNGITAVVKNGIVTLNGTATGTSFVEINLLKSIELTNDKVYHVSAFNEKTVGDSTNYCSLRLIQANIQVLFNTANANSSITTNLEIPYITIRTSQGITYNNFVVKPQLELGAGTNEWEQGGVSPSPDYPSEVECCGDNINFFDKDNANILDGCYINESKKIISSNAQSKTLYIEIQPNTTYTIHKVLSSRFAVGTFVDTPAVNVPLTNFLQDNSKTKITITSGENDNYLAVFYYHSNYDTTITPQEILNSIKIENGQGCINVVICNKNLFDKSSITSGYYITSSGTLIADKTTFVSNFIKVIENEYIAITYRSNWNNIGLYDKDKNFIKRVSIGTSGIYLIPEGCKYIRVNSLITDIDILQIERDNLTDYVEHKSQTYTIPTQQSIRSIEIAKNTFLRDTFIKKNNKWYERHYIARKIFDGTETFKYVSSSNVIYTDVFVERLLGKINFITSHFKVEMSSSYSTMKLNTAIGDSKYNYRIIFKTEYTNADDFKAWITAQYNAGTPVYIDYILETPLDIECTEEQSTILFDIEENAKTYDKVTHMYSTDNVSPVIDVTYKKDIETMITNIEQAILSQGGNI